jgi:hypothetical protein
MGNKESAGGGAGGPPPRVSQTRAGTTGGGDNMVNAIQTQKDAVSNLEKKIQQLELRIDQERKLAKQFLTASQKGDKTSNQAKAKRHLMNSKRFQAQVTRFEGMRTNLETVQNTLESAAISKTVQSTLVSGNQALKNVAKDMDPDKLADVVQELEENQQNLEEASNLISQPIGADPGLDLDVENDMEELERELQEEAAAEEAPVKTKKPAPKIPSLPEAPTGRVALKAKEDEDDAELNALMEEMN